MADFLIADADHAASVAAVRRWRVGTPCSSAPAAPEGAALAAAPIDPVHVMRALDELVELRLSAPSRPAR